MPLPIQRIQADSGTARDRAISTARSSGASAPTSMLWPTVELSHTDIDGQLAAWARFYNHEHPHDALRGSTPAQRLADRCHRIATRHEVATPHAPNNEHVRTRLCLFGRAVRGLSVSR